MRTFEIRRLQIRLLRAARPSLGGLRHREFTHLERSRTRRVVRFRWRQCYRRRPRWTRRVERVSDVEEDGGRDAPRRVRTRQRNRRRHFGAASTLDIFFQFENARTGFTAFGGVVFEKSVHVTHIRTQPIRRGCRFRGYATRHRVDEEEFVGLGVGIHHGFT